MPLPAERPRNVVTRLPSGHSPSARGTGPPAGDRERHHGALRNLIPDEVWYGRREAILARRRALKMKTLLARRYCSRGLTQQRTSGVEAPGTVASATPNQSHSDGGRAGVSRVEAHRATSHRGDTAAVTTSGRSI